MSMTPQELRDNCRDAIDAGVWRDWFTGPMYTAVRNYLADKKIKTCVDIGAATGMATGYMLHYFNPERMYCFEPDAANFSCLEKKHAGLPNVHLHNVGIFYGCRESAVCGVGDNNPLGYMSAAVAQEHYNCWGDAIKPYEGKIFKFIELEEVVESADLIKIDVEGSEYNIIENSSVVKNARWLLLETHNHDLQYIEEYIKKNLSHRIVFNQGTKIHLGFFLEKHCSYPKHGHDLILSDSPHQENEMPDEEKGAGVCIKENVLNNITGLIQEAEKLIQAKSILTARIILNEIMRHDSHNIVGLIDLSVCDILEGKNDDAVKKLNAVLSIDPSNKTAKGNLCYINKLKLAGNYKISIVVPSRNDNFGGSLFETATATLQTMSKTFDEVILVDFGSFAEPMFPTLNKTIQEKKGNIRIITVPRQWVVGKLGDDSTFADVLARNIGIRRATHDIIISSNIDIIPGPKNYFDFTQCNENVFYCSNKYMVERSLIEELRKRGLSWDQIQEYLFQTRKGYYRQGVVDVDPWSRVSGCGDFQIGHRKIWFHDKVRGFEEALIYKDYTDTNLNKKVIENGHYNVRPALFFYVFHQSHENIRGTCKQNDQNASVYGFGQTTNPSTWGFSGDTFEEYRI